MGFDRKIRRGAITPKQFAPKYFLIYYIKVGCPCIELTTNMSLWKILQEKLWSLLKKIVNVMSETTSKIIPIFFSRRHFDKIIGIW